MNQDEYIGNIVKNAVVALIIGIIITSTLYVTMYSINGIEIYSGFIILGVIYGFLFTKVDIFENNLDLIITNAVFAFFGSYVSMHLLFTSTLKIAMDSSFLTYQFAGICIAVTIVVNYIRDNYLHINPLGSLNFKLSKLPTVVCPECGVEVNSESVLCPECNHKFNFIYCPECGTKLDEDDEFCLECGHKMKEDSKKDTSKTNEEKNNKTESDDKKTFYCPNCTHKISNDSKFCPECGNKLKD